MRFERAPHRRHGRRLSAAVLLGVIGLVVMPCAQAFASALLEAKATFELASTLAAAMRVLGNTRNAKFFENIAKHAQQAIDDIQLDIFGSDPLYGTVKALGSNQSNTVAVLGMGGGSEVTAAGWSDTDAGTFHAIRWTLSGGTQDLGTLLGAAGNSIAFGASGDSSTVVGWSNTTPGTFPTGQHAFRRTQGGGMQDLGSLQGPTGTSTAYAANSDGSVVVGATDMPPNGPITVPGHAFRWTQGGGMQDLGSLGTGLGSLATAVNADGSVVVGAAAVASGGTHAFRWTQATGMQDLGAPQGIKWTTATAISDDGSIIIGYGDPTVAENGSFGWTQSGSSRPFRWTQATGLQELNAAFANGGVDMTGTTLTTALSLSGDGQFILGGGIFPDSPSGSGSLYFGHFCDAVDALACARVPTSTHDYNGDGKSDIAWRDTSGNLAIWEMNGTQVINPTSTFVGNVPISTWTIIGTSDFNGDGKGDILWRDTSGNVAIWEMNGTQILNPSTSFVGNVPINWSVVGVGDFNSDGMSDILWRDTAGNVAIWEMNGTQLLNPTTTFVGNVPTATWTIVGTGDFNADGNSDILWKDTAGDYAIWEMNGTQILNPSTSFVAKVPAPWSVKRVGDFNSDGYADILWTDGNGNYAIWEMNGTSVLNPTATFVANVPAPWSVIGTGDYNGDGKSDLLWTDGSGNYAIWEMNGTQITNPTATFVGNVPTIWSVQLPLGE